MAVDLEPILLADGLFQVGIDLDLGQVGNSAAARANKVAVRICEAVEALLAVDHAHALDVAPLLEKDQVAVYGAQAQVGVGGLQLLVDPLRGGVAVGAANCIQDSLTLFAVTDCALDNNPSLTIVIIIYNKIIT